MDILHKLLRVRDRHTVAVGVCLLGCFLYMILSEPLLNAIGLDYTVGQNISLQKIHPGALLILASFLIAITAEGNPSRYLETLARQQPASVCLLVLSILIFVYTGVRNGGHGIGFLLDTHVVVPLIALVLVGAPSSYTRPASLIFVGWAMLDAIIGLGEYVSHHRIYTFESDWLALHDNPFSASSLMGPPLASSLFLPLTLFTALSLNIPRILKDLLSVLFPVALLAFGNYLAEAVTLLGLGVLASHALRQEFISHCPSLTHAILRVVFFMLSAGLIAAYILCTDNQRAAALAQYEGILDSQVRAFQMLRLMSIHELFFGVPPDHITELASRVGITIPRSDIDNPWILMFLIMGGGFFILWLAATATFLCALVRKQSLALSFAVLAYFIIASTSNSFGRKDVIYPAMIGLIACARRVSATPTAPLLKSARFEMPLPKNDNHARWDL